MRILSIAILIFLLGCAQEDVSLSEAASSSGQGGSLARFTIIDNYLYTLETNQLDWYELQADGEPSAVGSIQLNEGKETIFPLDNLLFVGATDGMSIFAIGDNGEPQLQGEIQHFFACDPVVANSTHAFVTLRQESCGGFFGGGQTRNVLNIYDVNDINNPQWIAQYNMIDPRGMGLAGDILFLCEGEAGLRTLDVSDPLDVQFLAFKEDVHANDVIVLADRLLVIGPENITQLDYSDPANLVKISEIKIE